MPRAPGGRFRGRRAALSLPLRRLKEQGKTLLVVEHRLYWLSELADRALVMGNGVIVGDNTAGEFARLSAQEIESMGLRARSLAQLAPQAAGCSCESSAPEWLRIQADGLRAGYTKDHEVLKGASFRAAGDHVIAVLGKNGQGKSTLARVIAGLMAETYGGISLDARPLSVRHRAGHCVMVITHDAELVAAACDQAIEVDQGRVSAAYNLDAETFLRALKLLAPDAYEQSKGQRAPYWQSQPAEQIPQER